jgi:hypothetical protein
MTNLVRVSMAIDSAPRACPDASRRLRTVDAAIAVELGKDGGLARDRGGVP